MTSRIIVRLLFGGKQPRGSLFGLLRWSPFAVALAMVGLLVPSASAETVPAGFQARKLPILKSTEAPAPSYINGLKRPTAIAFGPDGKMYVGEWLGRVKVFDSVEDTTPTLSVDIATEVHTFGDRGLLGMKLDPEFGTTGHNFIYLSYAYDVPMGSLAEPHAEFSDGGDNCKNESPYTDCLISGKVVRIALNPATGVAAAGAVEPPQQQLVQSWCQQFNSHSMGDLEFDSSGALLASGGEGANYAASDYGQFSNPCGDPENAGGSLRAQDVREGGDQTDYSGSIIRIDPETGEALPDNPFFGSSDVRAQRILAYGLRNPFRFTIRPGTDEVYVGDVGQSSWEELDRLTSPPTSGQGALNFGWPCYEGGNGANSVMPAWKSFAEEVPSHAPLCQALYADPSLVTAPLWAYGHGIPNGYLFSGDTCDPTPGSAYSGLAFYDPTGVSPSVAFPAEYQGALFMADAARGCIWVMGAGSDGRPDPTDVTNFAVGDGAGKISPVDLVQGPDGALYAPNFYNESIEQIRYFGANEPPVARLGADKDDGALVGGKLTVHFDASASSDKEGDDFSYEWDLDGDGQFDDGSDQPAEEWTYATEDDVTVRVRVKDEFGRTDEASTRLYPGDLGPPVPTIEGPSAALEWAIGDTISYKGSATDPDGDPVTFKWRISIQHCPDACHEHPYTEPEGASGSFTAPPHEYPSHLSFVLTATDSRGRSTASSQLESFPRVIDVGLATDPPGIPVTFDGEPASAGPFKLIAGGTAAVFAPATGTVDGVPYVFSSWSDDGAASHQFTSKQSEDLVAHYEEEGGEEEGGGGLTPPPISTPSGSTIPPLVQLPPVVPTVRLTIVSRPSGIKIRAGKTRRTAPFSLSVPTGTNVALRAPAKTVHGSRDFVFRGWKVKGKLRKATGLNVIGRTDARYVAVYAAD
jgi:glucose/arabinose dehydrogenase